MRLMRKLHVVAPTLGLALGLAGAMAWAQGVAPGGPIGNSTGIGSGLAAPPGGTAPTWPNGTTQPTLPPPPPPGGGLAPRPPPPAISTARPPSYPQPLAPFGPPASRATTTPAPAAPLVLPQAPAGSLSFLKGCWRTDVFRYAGETGVATYCFDASGAGRFLYSRLDRPDFHCRGSTQARYAEGELRFHNAATSCSDGSAYPDDLDCRRGAGEAQCTARAATAGGSESWTVRLHRVR